MSATAWRRATHYEERAMIALSGCKFAPATMVKRFARSMRYQYDKAQNASELFVRITDRQAALLWKYCWHYRRQIKDSIVNTEAEKRWTEHDWREPNDTIKYPWCGKCMVIRRADDMNGPCKGPAKLRPMEQRLC